jgi:hypothetical protein
MKAGQELKWNKGFLEFSCIPGFLITKFVTKRAKSGIVICLFHSSER